MINNYEPIRTINVLGNEESQLDRIEKKIDKLLNLVGDKEQSTGDINSFISLPEKQATYRPLFANLFK